MATNLFVSSGGASKYTTAAPALLVGIKVEGKASLVDPDVVGILITGIAMSQGARVAYFNTLSESIYVYPLGNKVGKCIVTGTVFPQCSNGGANEYSNVKKLMDFYNSNKASTFENVAKPIKISIGSTVLAGFLEDIQVNITNEANMFGSASFSLVLAIMPEEAT